MVHDDREVIDRVLDDLVENKIKNFGFKKDLKKNEVFVKKVDIAIDRNVSYT